MTGLELAKCYYEENKAALFEGELAAVRDFAAVGLAGSGSECFGFDDEVSHDHDFEPGFCIFIPKDVLDSRLEFRLERAYAKLPKEFMGFKRNSLSPVGGNRHGVIYTGDFYSAKCGSEDGELSPVQWLKAPEYALAEAVNGEVFDDFLGQFTQIRKALSHYPEDIRIKKLAGYLLTLAQAGQYNYPRCIKRGETAGAQMAVYEFVNAALHSIYLINNRYMPYYKWAFRGVKDMGRLSSLHDTLEFLISTDNTGQNARLKAETIEDVARLVTDEIKADNLTDACCTDLEKHAYSVNDHVIDASIRNMNIFTGV